MQRSTTVLQQVSLFWLVLLCYTLSVQKSCKRLKDCCFFMIIKYWQGHLVQKPMSNPRNGVSHNQYYRTSSLYHKQKITVPNMIVVT